MTKPPSHTVLFADNPIGQLFTGRAREVNLLDRLLSRPDRFPAFVIGPCGVGKTMFCRMYAQLTTARYAGCLNIDAAHIRPDPMVMEQYVYAQLATRTKLQNPKADIGELLSIITSRADGKPFLFILDEMEALPELHLRRAINLFSSHQLHSRAIFSGFRTPGGFDTAKLRARTIELRPFTWMETEELIRKQLSFAGQDLSVAQRFFQALAAVGADYTQTTPRFLFHLLNAFLRNGEIDPTLINELKVHFSSVTNLVIANGKKGLRVLPVGHLDASEIITPTSKLIAAVPYVVIPNFARFWREKLEEFEALINNPNTTESQIQRFFERHPEFLKGIDYEKAIPHPVLERDDDGDLIPDFFLKPRRSELIDILDLKLPSEKLIVGKADRKKLSGSVTEAIAQLREYRDYFERPDYREQVLKKYGVRGYRPNSIIVIGRDPNHVPEEKVRQIFSDTPKHLQIVTYDDLRDRMKAMVEKNLL